jgi:hypothetical protein
VVFLNFSRHIPGQLAYIILSQDPFLPHAFQMSVPDTCSELRTMSLNKQRTKIKVSGSRSIVRKTALPGKMAICCYLFTHAAIGQAWSLVTVRQYSENRHTEWKCLNEGTNFHVRKVYFFPIPVCEVCISQTGIGGGGGTWTLRAIDQKHLESFEM